MPKRIVLFLLGVVLAVGAFLLYQFFSGASSGPVKKPKATVSTTPTTLPMTIEERDADGRLIYFITAPRAPEPIKDAAGNALPGQFRILSPVARLYDDTGRAVQVEADTCDIAVATLPTPAGGVGGGGGLSALTATGKSAIRLDQIAGSLYGHARLSVGAKPGGGTKGSKDPFTNGVRVYFDGPVKLDGASQQLTADDAIHIRSDVIEADQQGMKMTFLQKGKKREIQSLRIGENPNGNQIIVRDQGDKALNLLGDKDKDKAGNGGNAAAVAPDTAAKPAESVPVYQLTFGKDVLARAGDRSLSAQGMSVIFSPTKQLMGQDSTKPAADAAPQPAAALPLNATMPALETIPLEVNAIKPAEAKDLVITWSGPLEMLPADPDQVKLSAPDEVILDATGTAQKPVTIRKDAGPKESGFEALAGRLKFQTRQPTVLLPDAYGKVVLRGMTVASAAGAPGRWNEVICGQTTLTKEDSRILAQLMGPGVLTDRQTEKGVQTTTIARWKTVMDLVLVPDPNDAKGNNFAIRSAKFDGAQITRDGPKAFDFNADTLDVLLANVKGLSSPQIDHILAMGKVNVDRHGTRAEDQGGIATDRLEIQTQKGAANAAPVLSALNADGNVKAWRYTEKNRTLAIGAASTPASAPAALPAGVAGYTKEAITADKLFAALSPREKSATPAASAPASGFVDIGDNIEVSHFVAQRNVRLEVTPPSASATPPLLALADAIDAYPLKKSALITGGSKPDGTPNAVHVTHGKDQMEGQRIEIDGYKDSHDNDSYNIHVPGPGSFASIMPASKTRPQPTPLNVTWQDGMNYDGTNQMIVFNGKPVARSPGKFEDQAFLSCDKTITIKVRNKKSDTQPAGASDKFDPELEWLQAVGNVDARGAMYDANDKLLSRVRLSAPNSLKYTADGEMIDIPGKGFMVVEDNRPEKPGSQYSTAGETDFVWNGSLVRDAKGLITIAKEVDFIFRPTKPFRLEALGGQKAAASAAPPRPTYVHLHTDRMVATPKPKDPNAKKADNPINIGAEGIAKVDVTEGAKLDIGTYTLTNNVWDPTASYLITGQKMNVDVTGNTAVIAGTTEEPAIVEQLGTGQGTQALNIDVDMANGAVKARNVVGNFTLNTK